MNGPGMMSSEERWRVAHEIAGRAMERYGSRLKAVGVYGSLARGIDGPFSDIEMFCVLRSSGESCTYEWSAGLWKAEVNFCSEDVLLHKAASVSGTWPLTHGKYFSVLPFHDPESFFPELRKAAESPPEENFRRAIRDLLIEELFELAGKWRNIGVQGPVSYLPSLAVKAAECGAMMVGLHHRTCFTTAARMLPEALGLPNRPAGFDPLCEMVMAGDLSDPKAVLHACEAFWKGAQDWCRKHGEPITESKRIPF